MTPLLTYFKTHPECFYQLDYLVEIFTIADRLKLESCIPDPEVQGIFIGTVSGKPQLYKGKLVVHGDMFYSILHHHRVDDRTQEEPRYQLSLEPTGIPYKEPQTEPLLTPQTTFTLSPHDTPNFKANQPITTTVGRFIVNHLLIVAVFQDRIPYKNTEIKDKYLEDIYSNALLEKTVDARTIKDIATDNYYFLLSHPQLFSPNMTEKSLTTDPKTADVREKMYKERKDAIDNGDPIAMNEIEQTLIQMDKDRLKDDPSWHFLSLSKKSFNNSRKRLLLTGGAMERFGAPGQYSFVKDPIGKGWVISDIPTLLNDSRMGSQSRALETAKGGEDAKFLGRVLQDLYIVSLDCKTKTGMLETLTRDTMVDQLERYIITEGNKEILLTKENIDQYNGTTQRFRSPMFCTEKKGYCARCLGHTFEVLQQTALSTPAKKFSEQVTTDSLKRIHVSGVDTIYIGNLNDFVGQN